MNNNVSFSLETIKSTSENLKNRIHLPERAKVENTTSDFYHNTAKNSYLLFINSISEMDNFFSRSNEQLVLERDRKYFNEQRKILHNEAAKNICTVIEYFNYDFLADRKLKDFTDKTEEYNTAVLMAAQQIDIILPTYQKAAVQAAFYSPFNSVREIAIDLFNSYDREQVTNFFGKDHQFVTDIKEYIRKTNSKK
jgi:hypothetical protein